MQIFSMASLIHVCCKMKKIIADKTSWNRRKTLLGFGLSNEQPAIGIILSEAMKYLVTGKWWLAVFPGVMLVFTVICFCILGDGLRKLLDPASAHE